MSALTTPEFIGRRVKLFKQAKDREEADPLLLIATFVLDFECIRPFRDGNGRIGRLLTLHLLYQAGYEVGRYFTIGDLKRACPCVSYPTLQRALADLRKEKKVRCLGRGPDASWERIGS